MPRKTFYNPHGRRYDIMVGVHASRDLKDRLERAVVRAGVTQSEFIRQLLETGLTAPQHEGLQTIESS